MKELIIGVYLSCAADSASTHYALSRGGREVFLMQSPMANHVIVGTHAIVVHYGLDKLARRRPRLARGLAVAIIVARGAVAAHNIRAGQRSRR